MQTKPKNIIVCSQCDKVIVKEPTTIMPEYEIIALLSICEKCKEQDNAKQE